MLLIKNILDILTYFSSNIKFSNYIIISIIFINCAFNHRQKNIFNKINEFNKLCDEKYKDFKKCSYENLKIQKKEIKNSDKIFSIIYNSVLENAEVNYKNKKYDPNRFLAQICVTSLCHKNTKKAIIDELFNSQKLYYEAILIYIEEMAALYGIDKTSKDVLEQKLKIQLLFYEKYPDLL